MGCTYVTGSSQFTFRAAIRAAITIPKLALQKLIPKSKLVVSRYNLFNDGSSQNFLKNCATYLCSKIEWVKNMPKLKTLLRPYLSVGQVCVHRVYSILFEQNSKFIQVLRKDCATVFGRRIKFFSRLQNELKFFSHFFQLNLLNFYLKNLHQPFKYSRFE